ncbi:Myosin regulatory light chain, partial [Lachnellula suecica]
VEEDVADMLTQLGLPANVSDITAFFPPSTPQNVTLPAYLNGLAGLLAALSPSSELLSAFSAFDEDDSGQIDLAELRDALLHTAPEAGEKALTEREIDRVMSGFTGRRAFGKHAGGGMGKRGEVFKYQEFVSSVAGGASVDGKEKTGDE